MVFYSSKPKPTNSGKIHYRYQQTYKNIPIAHAQLLVHTSKEGFVEAANGRLIRNLNESPIPAFFDSIAISTALDHIGGEEYAWQSDAYQKLLKKVKKDPNATFYPKGKLEWASSDFTDRNPRNYRLSYQLQVYAIRSLQHVKLYVDAQNRAIINELPQLYDSDSLATGEINYDACMDTVEFHTEHHEDAEIDFFTLNNSLGSGISTSNGIDNYPPFIDGNNHWSSNKTAIDIHWAMEQTYFYFLNQHNLDSLGSDNEILGVAHAANNCNASWNGQWAKFGDGGIKCNPVTSPDIVAHELTHRVIQHSANLIYEKESGALNESFSDIFGVLVHFEADSECANWVIGDEVKTFNNAPLGFRDMSNPKAFSHPDTYLGNCWNPTNSSCTPNTSCTNYSNCGKDKYGVHINSGVQNYWFYLLSEGGNGTNDNGDAYNITGIGKEEAANIAYRNLNVYLSPTSNYADARNGSIEATKDLYGDTSTLVQIVTDAWCAVGVGNSNCTVLEANLTLESPNGGEEWSTGTTESITWTSEGSIENIHIDYSINEGGTWQTLVNSTPNDGSFQWEIPSNLSTNLALIRIIATNDITLQDESDAAFSIEACNVQANFTTNTNTICVGESINFTNNSLNANTYERQILAEDTTTTTDFSYTFNTEGTFIVNLISTSENGCSDHFYETIEVNGTPDASFNHQPNGLTLQFIANELNANTYNWDFGDGTVAEDTSFLHHTYDVVGTYTVCLAVETDCGNNQTCQEIEVTPATCLFADSLELVKLYEATDGEQWTNNSGWLEEPVSEWFGVTLSDDGCSVEEIDLRSNDLIGSLPNLNLPNLSQLILYSNRLNGNIPNFNYLLNLSYLHLGNNQLNGNIPNFNNLDSLKYLNFSHNQLSGTIPNFDQLHKLTHLILYNNQLIGDIPNFNNLPDLEHLSLDENQISGAIPDFSNLLKLRFLNLEFNRLSGPIPNFSNLSTLSELYLGRNQLNGTIPNFDKLSSLTYLYLRANQLSGNIPDFDNLPSLTRLHLSNNQLSGAIPNFNNLINLERLYLTDNQLSGNIPDFDNLSKLEHLHLYDNQLSGNIPDFDSLSKLKRLYLYDNQLSGNIPGFDNLTNLEYLYLYNNQLSGNIPDFNNLTNLKYLNIADNQINGTIPDFSDFADLIDLKIENNQFTFEGLEGNINYYETNLLFNSFSYVPQSLIPIYKEGDTLRVVAGKDLENNTYWWYELGDTTAVDIITADSTFVIPSNSTASYYCKVTNSIATELTLLSHLLPSSFFLYTTYQLPNSRFFGFGGLISQYRGNQLDK